MRFHDPLDAVLGRLASVRLLRLLVRFPSREFTGREIARLAGVATPSALRALEDLRRSGILRSRIVGRATLWSFRQEHYLAQPLATLFEADHQALRGLTSVLSAELGTLGIEEATIFGSVARGEERPESDIDLWVPVREGTARDLASRLVPLIEEVSRRFGNTLSPLVTVKGARLSPSARQVLDSAASEGLRLRGRSPSE